MAGHSFHKRQFVLYTHKTGKKKKQNKNIHSSKYRSSIRALKILSCSPYILRFRTRVSDKVPEKLRRYLAQDTQTCDATAKVIGGGKGTPGSLENKSPVNSQ